MDELQHHKEKKLQIILSYLKEVNAPVISNLLNPIFSLFIIDTPRLSNFLISIFYSASIIQANYFKSHC